MLLKSLNIALIFILAGNMSCGNDVSNKSEPNVQKELKGDFETIKVSSSIQAEVVKSDMERVVVSGPENLMKKLVLSNDNGNLVIEMGIGKVIRFGSQGEIKAKIYATDFSTVEANSSATIKIKDKFLSEKMKVKASSSAEITGHLEANEFDMDLTSSSVFSGTIWAVNFLSDQSSSSLAKVSGKATKATIKSTSSSAFEGRDFVADDVYAKASSSSTIDIAVRNNLDADASSSASIKYRQTGKNLWNYNATQSSSGMVTMVK